MVSGMASKATDITEMNESVQRMRKSCLLTPLLRFKKQQKPEGPRQIRLLEIRKSLDVQTRDKRR